MYVLICVNASDQRHPGAAAAPWAAVGEHRVQALHSNMAPALPGPGLPAEAQGRLWMEAPTRLLEAAHAAHGDLFALDLGGFGQLAIVAAPEGVRQVFELPPTAYECRPFNESYRYAMGDHALFLQDGAAHRDLKRRVAPLFSETALAGHGLVVAEETQAVLDALGDGGEIPLRPLTHAIAVRSLLRLVLGESAAARAQILAIFEDRIWRDLRAWKAWTALSRARPAILALLQAALDARRADPDAHDDLLARLAGLRDADGAALDDAVILDQVMMLTITAGDAVAVAAAWALDRLARHGEVQAQLRAGAPDYAEAVCREVLRLHPVLPTISGRRLTAPVDILGHRVAAGVTLAPCEYLVHRRADLFEAPLEFRPERFLGRRPYAPSAYFPFGGRERACLGGVLAPMTVRAVMQGAVALGRLEATDDREPAVVRHGTLLAPSESHAIRLNRRVTAHV